MKKTISFCEKTITLRLKNISLKYLERYSTSEENLRKYLKRKIIKYYQTNTSNIQEDNSYHLFIDNIDSLIENVIKYLKEFNYINDYNYAKLQVRSMIKKGKSKNHIIIKLKEKGIQKDEIEKVLSLYNQDNIEIFSALKFFNKKKMKHNNEIDNKLQYDIKQKQMAQMLRNGFSYEVIKQIFEMNNEQKEEIFITLNEQIDL